MMRMEPLSQRSVDGNWRDLPGVLVSLLLSLHDLEMPTYPCDGWYT